MRRTHDEGGRKLAEYNEMRDFDRTREPSGRVKRSTSGHAFVIQKHAARRLHYDFRLELDGVLLSWAVPKGPSLSPAEKRLAVQVEDHPVDYGDFEGTIPKGQYGGGSVIVWDRGTWEPIGDPHQGLERGRLDFELDGQKLHGRFLLVRTRRNDGKKPSWLLMKRDDEHATKKEDVVTAMPESVLSGKTIEEVENGPPKAKLPPFGSIQPQLATLVDELPRQGDWLYEIKYDGYRTIAWVENGKVQLASRHGLDWSAKYPAIADALSRVRVKNAIFDGEVAYVLEDGRTSFQKLQNALGSRSPEERSRLVYFVFDLLFYDGVDLRDEPLTVRKDKLRTILAGEAVPLRFSDHVIGDGRPFFEEACKKDLEGIIGKRTDRPYFQKRTKDWIKVKCARRQEFVVVGFTKQKNSSRNIGALLVGLKEGTASRSSLRYAGKVGTGFSQATLKDLANRLGKIVVDEAPVTNAPRMTGVTWVKPELVAEIRFSEWTSDGILRHPAFQGLRLDKTPSEVHREKPTKPDGPGLEGIKVTHPDRVIDKDTGATKLELVKYASAVARAALPFVAKRPLMLIRCPSGTEKTVVRQKGNRTKCFVQKHSGQGVGKTNLGSQVLDGEEALYVTTTKQLILLAQQNTIELHGWGCTLPKWDRPDWMVFDLDPDETLPFSRVIDGAMTLRDALRTLGLESWVKTTGGKGLHVVVPIARRYDWETVKNAAHHIASLIAKASPDRFVATMSKKARHGKIFIDYLRNGQGATAVLPYSARARPGLPVAMPIAWKDVRAVDPSDFTIATVPDVIARRRRDPWEDLLGTRQTLPRQLVSLNGDE